MLSNHTRRALFAGGTTALIWAAAEALAKHKTVRMTALLGLTAGLAGMATSSVKSQSTEARLNALVPKIPTPQTAPGTVGAASHDASGQVTSAPASQSNGSNSPPTTATTHYHFNGEQTVYNILVDAHNGLVTSHNNLITTLKNSGILH